MREGSPRAAEGGATTPPTRMSSRDRSRPTRPAVASRPNADATRSPNRVHGGKSSTRLPPDCNTKCTSGNARAALTTTSATAADCALSPFWNFRRAGTLKNRSSTLTAVPRGQASGRVPSRPFSASMRIPTSSSDRRVTRLNRDTEAMEGRASPRKPIVRITSRSEAVAILLVAWRCSATPASSAPIPPPSSTTRIRPRPPRSDSTTIRAAPASMAFSTSSLTTEAGFSTTSPAAIWFTRSSGRTWIRGALMGRSVLSGRPSVNGDRDPERP